MTVNLIRAYSGVGAIAGSTSPFKLHRLTIGEPEAAWRKPLFDRLQHLIRLDNGWDGYKGLPVSLENAAFALRMLDALCGPETESPQIVPGTSGDLHIEWHTLSGDLELWVRGPNNVHAWRCLVDGDEDGEEVELTNDFLPIATWISEVTEPQIALAAAA